MCHPVRMLPQWHHPLPLLLQKVGFGREADRQLHTRVLERMETMQGLACSTDQLVGNSLLEHPLVLQVATVPDRVRWQAAATAAAVVRNSLRVTLTCALVFGLMD